MTTTRPPCARTRVRAAAATAGLLAVLLLSGCTGEEEPAPAPTPVPTAEEAAPMTVEEAQAEYTDLAAAANAAVPAFQAAGAAGDQVALRSLATERVELLQEFAEGLEARTWPEEAQPAVDRLVDQISAEVPLWQEAGAAEVDDEETYQTALERLPGLPAAAEVRTALGLEGGATG